MRNRDLFIPSISTLILFGFVWFLSCAHQNRWKDEAEGETVYTETADLNAAPTGQDQTAQAESQTEPISDPLTHSDGSDEFKADNENSDVNSEASSQETAPTEPFASSSEPPAVDQASSGLDEKLSEPEAPADSSALMTETEPEVEAIPAPKKRVSWLGKVPQIPTKAIWRNKTKLNRFYFARLGDTPTSVSKLIYADNKHSKKLVSWNGKNWKPGTLLFYVSPMDPKDSRMGSFYKERSLEPEEVTIKSGDWLTRIAKSKLGNTLSWKEIAVVNGLKHPNSLEVGERLAIYPKDLNRAKARGAEPLAQSAAAPEKTPENDRFEEEPKLPPKVENTERFAEVKPAFPNQEMPSPSPKAEPNAQPQVPSVQEPEAQAPVDEMPAAEASTSPSQEMNWQQIMEQESLAILIGAALVILLLALRVRKKRLKGRTASSGGSSEDGYSEDPPSKYGKGR